MEINRRDFIKLIGTSIAGLAVGSSAGAVMKIPKSMKPVLYSGPRIESWKITTCAKCPGNCSLKIRMIDKFPIQAFGNKLSPVNDGGICSIGLASISDLYHPSRITGPLKKVNNKFVPVTYKEAYKILLDNLKSAVDQDKQNDIFLMAQTESKLRAGIFDKFSQETGIKNLIIDNYLYNSIFPYNEASAEAPDFIDFDKCDYLLSFNAQLSETSVNPLFFARKLIEFRDKGYKITHAGPKLTPGISKSDDWVPVSPSASGDLALGIAYVLLKDGFYDKNAETTVTGFNSLKKYILDNYYPQNVEQLTGVSSDKILELGKNFENASAPAAYFDESVLYNSNGTFNALSVIALNALKGFSGYGKIKDAHFSKVTENMRPKFNSFSTFTDRLNNKNDIKILLISGSNFIFNNPGQKNLQKQVESIPFIVSFSPFIDESSSLAHLIIPDHNEYEKLDLRFDETTGKSIVSVQQPVVEPFFKTTDTGDVFISLIKDLNPGSGFKYDSYAAYIKSTAEKLYVNGNGTVMNQSKFTEIEKGLREIGWQTEQFAGFDDFWEGLKEYGGWWNPFGEIQSYRPKINFTGKLSPFAKTKKSPAGSRPENKLVLNVFRKNLDYKGNMSIYPVLVEQFGHIWSVFYEIWAEINPETARSKSLRDRSRIYIKTSKGKFPAVLVYNPAVKPDSLDVPFGLGHTILGDTSGINPLTFTGDIYDKISGKPSYSETFADIELTSGNNYSYSLNLLNNKKDLRGSVKRSKYA